MYKAILESLKSDPIVFVDDQHIVRYMNETARRKFVKQEGDDLIGKSIFQCHGEKSAEMIKAYFKDMQDGKIESVNVRKKGHIQGVMQVVKDEAGQVIGYLERHEVIHGEQVNLKENQYQKGAYYYDALMGSDPSKDIEFYKTAIGTEKDVLEIGCGTGRIGMELAKENNRVVGVDISKEMINLFNEKIIQNIEVLKYPIKTFNIDFLDYNGTKKFDYVILPLGAFQVFFSDKARRAVLEKVKSHLKVGGQIIMDVYAPDSQFLTEFSQLELVDKDVFDHCLEIRIIRKMIGKKHFEQQQIISYENQFKVYRGEELIESFLEPMRLSYQFHDEMVALFADCDLELLAAYGSWNKASVDLEGKGELIYIVA